MRCGLLSSCVSCLFIPALAVADELPKNSAYTLDLKNHYSAVVYYVDAPEGFQVVATVAAENGPAMRFINHLADGQTVVLEAAGDVGEEPDGVVLSRIGDILDVTPLPRAAGIAIK